MKDETENSTGFYFALPRLFNWWRGRPHQASEANAFEAYLGSVGIFALTYVFGWSLFARKPAEWRTILAAVLLVPAVWVFWISVFFINAFFIKLLHANKLFRGINNRDAQNIYIGFILSAFAVHLSILQGWTHWLGTLGLFAIGANFLAMIILAIASRHG
jgi:hypothetical protein